MVVAVFSMPRKYIHRELPLLDAVPWNYGFFQRIWLSLTKAVHATSSGLHKRYKVTKFLSPVHCWRYLLFYKMTQWCLYSFGQELSFTDLFSWLIKERRGINNSAWKLHRQHLWQLQRSQTMKCTTPTNPRIHKAWRFSLLAARGIKFWCISTFAIGFYCICLH